MLRTEMRNPATTHIDQMDLPEMLKIINAENRRAVEAVETALPSIAQAIDAIVASFSCGGRLIYVGAGTSGRMAVADAAECPPTFGISADQITAIMAGGPACMAHAAEAEEDNAQMGRKNLLEASPTARDVLVGISASGGAAYVLGAMEQAKALGCTVISLTSNPGSLMEQASDIAICTDTGPEVITGSTRMKAGTAQKLVLNMLSTCSMVRMGMVYENMMVNIKPSNDKLRNRMLNIVMELTGWDEAQAKAQLEQQDWNIRRTVDAG